MSFSTTSGSSVPCPAIQHQLLQKDTKASLYGGYPPPPLRLSPHPSWPHVGRQFIARPTWPLQKATNDLRCSCSLNPLLLPPHPSWPTLGAKLMRAQCGISKRPHATCVADDLLLPAPSSSNRRPTLGANLSSTSPPSPALRGGRDKPVVRPHCPADDDDQ